MNELINERTKTGISGFKKKRGQTNRQTNDQANKQTNEQRTDERT